MWKPDPNIPPVQQDHSNTPDGRGLQQFKSSVLKKLQEKAASLPKRLAQPASATSEPPLSVREDFLTAITRGENCMVDGDHYEFVCEALIAAGFTKGKPIKFSPGSGCRGTAFRKGRLKPVVRYGDFMGEFTDLCFDYKQR